MNSNVFGDWTMFTNAWYNINKSKLEIVVLYGKKLKNICTKINQFLLQYYHFNIPKTTQVKPAEI